MKRRIYLALFDLFDRFGWERARLWAIERAGALTDWGEGADLRVIQGGRDEEEPSA